MIKILTLFIISSLLLISTPFVSALDAKIDQTHYNWYEGFSISGTVTKLTSPIISVEVKCGNNLIDSQQILITNDTFWYGTSIRGYVWENNQCPQYSAIITYENQTLSIPFTVEQVEITTPAPIPTPEPIPVDNPPVIILLGNNPLHITAGNHYIEFGATATDDIDGNLTNSIGISTNNLNMLIPASYIVNYVVMDSAVNISMINRTVIVDPIITLEPIVEPSADQPISNSTNIIPTNNTSITNGTIPDISVITNSTIPSPSLAIPNWVKAVFSWWSENRLTDEELKDTIRFLVNNGIIEL